MLDILADAQFFGLKKGPGRAVLGDLVLLAFQRPQSVARHSLERFYQFFCSWYFCS